MRVRPSPIATQAATIVFARPVLRWDQLEGARPRSFSVRWMLGSPPNQAAYILSEVFGIAAREDHSTEAVAIGASHAAVILEPLEGVVVQHLAPEIGVVAGGVLIAPDVQKIAGAITRGNVAQGDIGLLQSLFLEVVGVFEWRAGRQRVPLHIELRGGQQFGEVVALVEGFRLLDFGHELRGHGCAGLVVLGVMIEHGGIAGPVLVELRWEFDEIVGHVGAGQAWIFGIGEHGVQRMAEFVEDCGYIIEAEQRGLAGCGLAEIRNVINDGQGVEELGARDKVIHPGAAVFVVAFEVVAIPQRERLAVSVDDFEDAHVGVVDGNIVALLEREAVELVGGEEEPVLQDVV